MKFVTVTSDATGNPILVNLANVTKITVWMDEDGKRAGTAISFDNDTVFVKEPFKAFEILMQSGRLESVRLPDMK
jgi:hypothetical protein